MSNQDSIKKANEVAAKIESKFGSFWETAVWSKGETVRVYVTSGKKRCGHIEISENGVKPRMNTLRDTNRVNEVL